MLSAVERLELREIGWPARRDADHVPRRREASPHRRGRARSILAARRVPPRSASASCWRKRATPRWRWRSRMRSPRSGVRRRSRSRGCARAWREPRRRFAAPTPGGSPRCSRRPRGSARPRVRRTSSYARISAAAATTALARLKPPCRQVRRTSIVAIATLMKLPLTPESQAALDRGDDDETRPARARFVAARALRKLGARLPPDVADQAGAAAPRAAGRELLAAGGRRLYGAGPGPLSKVASRQAE